jgi:hypothetical protein
MALAQACHITCELALLESRMSKHSFETLLRRRQLCCNLKGWKLTRG